MANELSDVAAERAVLAGLCQHGVNTYLEICDWVNVKSFTFSSNQSIYKCLEHLFKNREITQVDLPSVWSAANDLGLSQIFAKPDEVQYLRSLFNFPINPGNVRKLAGKIRKLDIIRTLKKKMLGVADQLSTFTGDEPVNSILALPETAVLEFSQGLEEHEESQLMGEGIEDYIRYLGENQRETVGISTGFRLYNKMIGNGLLPGVNLLGARPKVGKTTIGDNIAMNIAIQGIHVLNLDTEMTRKNHWERLLAYVSGVPVDIIRTGKFWNNDYERDKVEQAGKFIKGLPYRYESVIGLDMESILSIIRRWLMKYVGFQPSGVAKPCAIIYDYLKLASENAISQNIQEYQALGFQINSLHNFVAKYEIPNLALIQLNRDGITKEDTSIISGSDRQVWACTSFCAFKKKTPEEMAEDPAQEKCNRKIVQLAVRYGDEWEEGDYINMNMQGQFARITEGKSRNELYSIQKKGELIDDPNNIPEEDRQFQD